VRIRRADAALQSNAMRIFISHSASDSAFADAMCSALTREGYRVWNPERELLPGDNWLLEAGRALERADAVVLLLSPESIDSAFAKYQFQYVIAHAKFEHRVFPVILAPHHGKVPWVFKDLAIDARNTDADHAAKEIASRLASEKRAKPAAPAKRSARVSASRAVSRKSGKPAKRKAKTSRAAAG
jgi:hypothetical protein